MKIGFTVLGLLAFTWAHSLPAQVPQIINHQGRVAVRGNNFNGTGLFKFSLVDGNGTNTFWSNDGSASNGRQPASAVPVLVDHGIYSVGLGDTALSNMTPIATSVFLNSDVRLRIWFSDGESGFELLSPDQRIAAVGYAMIAGNVPDGAIGAEKLAPGAALASLAGGSGAGAVTFSSNPESRSLIEAGFDPIGSMPLPGRWQNRETFLSSRGFHTAVWTGREMLAWGGGNFDFFNDGGRYDPASNSWTPMSSSNAPSPRWFISAIWTGREMLIWGGRSSFWSSDHRVDGGKYNPRTDTWTTISTNNAPGPRSQFTPIWTGTELLVWGGMEDGTSHVNTGGRYNPETDTWRPISTEGAPSGRVDYAAVWTGREMIVWGGWNITADVTFGEGARYNPATDTWQPITLRGAPQSVHGLSAVWTGTEMILWGGRHQPDNLCPNRGARYNPATDSWRPISSDGAPEGRFYHTTVWTGSEMIVWGGSTGGGLPEVSSGGQYDPASDTWITIPTRNAPAPRLGHTAVWTGRGMLILGGYQNHPSFEHYDSNTFYQPAKAVYVYEKH